MPSSLGGPGRSVSGKTPEAVGCNGCNGKTPEAVGSQQRPPALEEHVFEGERPLYAAVEAFM